MSKTNDTKGYRIESRYTIDDGRNWKSGGLHTARQTWFSHDADGLKRACDTAQSIVDALQRNDVMAVVIDEEEEGLEGINPVVDGFTYKNECDED